jgi:hypothetical protein
MEELIKFQALQLNALRTENEMLKNELKQARELFQAMINDWEVIDAKIETPVTNVFDVAFDSPLSQLNKLY